MSVKAIYPTSVVAAGFLTSADTTLTVNDVAPTATLSGTAQEGGPGTVTFSNQASFVQTAGFLYSYDIGNTGTFEVKNSSSPTYSIPASYLYQSGTLIVRARITDQNGLNADSIITFPITNLPPTFVTIDANKTVYQNALVALNNASFSDPGEDVITASINWGDGTSSQGAVTQTNTTPAPTTGTVSASHVYTVYQAAPYTVTVTLEDDDGATAQKTFQVTVQDPPLSNVTAGSNLTVSAGSLFTLTGASYTDPGASGPYTATVNWGDGSPIDTTPTINAPATGADLGRVFDSHYFGQPGAHTVTVSVTKGNLTAVSNTFTVTVNDVAPEVDAGPSILAGLGVPVKINAIFSDPSFPVGGTSQTYTASINWGDNTSSIGTVTVTPGSAGVLTAGVVTGTHQFNSDGPDNVTVTVTDGTLSGSSMLSVSDAPPTFQATSVTGNEGSPVNLNAKFSDLGFNFGGVTKSFTATINWGDNTSSAGTVAFVSGSAGVPTTGTVSGSHAYTTFGTYDVTVVITDEAGAQGQEILLANVNDVAPTIAPFPVGTFTGSNPFALDLNFNDAGTGDTHTVAVNWGDGTISTADDQSVYVATSGALLPIIVEPTTTAPPGHTTLGHTYADGMLNRVITATVTDNGGLSTTESETYAVTGTSTGSQIVATFTDSNPNAVAANFSSKINWGDGNQTSGPSYVEVSSGPSGSVWDVVASHTFAQSGIDVTAVSTTATGGSISQVINTTFNVATTTLAPVQFSTTGETVNASAGTFSLTVALSAASASDVTIPFTLGGTAVSGSDYSNITTTPLTILAGQTSATITGSLLAEGTASKTLIVTLGTPTGATLGSNTVNTLTINEPPAAPTVQFSATSETESANAGTFSLTVTLSFAEASAVSIPFTLGGTARSGTDFSNVTATPLTIAAGQTSATITGTLLAEGTVNKTLIVTLGTPTGATLGSNTVNTLTITEPPATPSLQFSATSETVNASAGTFSMTVALSADSATAVTIPFTLGGTAVSGSDFSNITATPLSIAAGQTSATITGTLLAEGTVNKTLIVTLGTPTGATLGSNTVNTLTINEPPVTPNVQFSATSETVNASTGTFSLTVALSAASASAVSIPFALGGTAVSGTDYGNFTAFSLTIAAGQTSGTITGTLLPEGTANKTLIVTLGTPSGATLDGNTVNTLTISEPTSTPTPTVQFSTGSETVNASAGTFSIPVTITPAPSVSTTIFGAGISTPFGLAFNPTTGIVYVASASGSGGVTELTPGGGSSVFASEFFATNLAFDAAGDVFGADGATVNEVTPSGVISTLASGFTNATGLAVDPKTGVLYVSDLTQGTISTVTPGGVVNPFVTGLDSPYSLAFDQAGNLYVGSEQGVVSKVSSTGQVSPFATIPGSATGLAIDAAGDVYVGTEGSTVEEVSPSGVVSTLASGFSLTYGVAVDSSGNVYVSDYLADSVSKISGGPVSVPFTLGGSAIAGTDYSGITASPLTFAVGQTTATITGTLSAEGAVNKTLKVTLGTPSSGATLGSNNVNTLSISEPPATPTVQLSTTSETVNASAGTFSMTVALSAASATAVTIPFTLGGTAVSGSDFSNITATPLVIAAGQTTGTITGTLLAEGTANKTLIVTLGTPNGATLGSNNVNTLSINEPPATPTVQFSATSETVNASTGMFSLTVTLSAASASAVSIPFTLGGTAASGTDFSNVTATPLTIAAGQTSGTITGSLLADGTASKTLIVTLGTPTGATLGGNTVNILTVNQAAPPPVTVISAHWQSLSVRTGKGKKAKTKSENVLEIQFSGPLAGAANLSAYQLSTVKTKKVKKKEVTTYKPIRLSSVLPSESPLTTSVALLPASKPSLSSTDQLQITTADLTDAQGRPLAGNNGQPGGKFVATLNRGGIVSLARTMVEPSAVRVTAAAIDAMVADGSLAGIIRHHARSAP